MSMAATSGLDWASIAVGRTNDIAATRQSDLGSRLMLLRLRELLHDIQFGLRFRHARTGDVQEARTCLTQLGMADAAERLATECGIVSRGRKPTPGLVDFVQSLHGLIARACEAILVAKVGSRSNDDGERDPVEHVEGIPATKEVQANCPSKAPHTSSAQPPLMPASPPLQVAAETSSDPPGSVHRVEATEKVRQHGERLLRLLRVLTNGVADERIKSAAGIVDDNGLTVCDKLEKLDELLPIPATASAEQLGKLFGVTKQAVMKTGWWKRMRRGEKDSAIVRREDLHRQRSAVRDE